LSASLKPVLAQLGRGETLTQAEAEAAFGLIMDGAATPGQIGGLLMAMRARGETVAELTGAVTAMRARITFVLAACGVRVAKHGNRALSSRAGGADVLLALGVDIEPPLDRLPEILATAGCVFLFAPRHHPALRHAGPVRTELGTRTIFNLTGPMANPAGVARQLIGVFDPIWARPMAETLANLGTTAAWIVYGNGLDELTLDGPNLVVALKHGEISEFTLDAADAGLPAAPQSAIKGGDAAHNAAALQALLDGAAGPYRDTILFNTAAALIVAGRTTNLPEGVALAAAAIDSGKAKAVLDALRATSGDA
jgi:anthranilate phosphoribosyltransferase/anthranilate synthase/phosphoribosyltransferase